MRIMRRGMGLSALIAASLLWSNGALRANDLPVVHVKAVVKDGSVRLEATANGPLEYTTYRPSESLYVVELSGVSTTDPAGARIVASDLVKSYRLVPYSVGNKPMVRMEILMSRGVDPQVQRDDAEDIDLVLSRTGSAASTETLPVIRQTAENSTDSRPPVFPIESIEGVNLGQNGDQTEVSILGSGRLHYQVIRLQNPDRLVVDFAGSHLRTTTKHIASNLDPIREIRIAQFTPDTSRVVIDLRAAAGYNVNADGNKVTVSFGPAAATSGASQATPIAAPTDLLSASAKGTTTEPAPVQNQSAGFRPMSNPMAVLPASLTSSAADLASPAPAKPQQEAAAAMHLASNASAAASAASGSDVSPASAQQGAPADSAQGSAQMPMASSSPRYTGEPISVNLKNVDLLDFFRLIHEISGLNVVVDPNVKGSFTIVLDNVPWDQALDIALKDNELDKQLDGNVLRIATKATLRKEAEDNRDLAKAQMEAADVVTTTRVLNYAKATNLLPTLKKFLSSRGDVIADDRSNTLIIRDVASTLPVIDNLLRQLDRKAQQVEIEARIVSATRNFSRDIGTQFGIATGNVSRSNIIGGAAGTSPITRVFGNPAATPPTLGLPIPPVIVNPTSNPTTGSIPLLSNLGASAPTSGVSYAFSSTNFALDMIITAAESKGVGKLLSQTKLFTQNNQKDYVKQGTKIPVQTVVNNTVSVQFVDAVLELDVTPQITADGNVYMDVTVENDQVNNNVEVQGIPEIITQAVESKVTVDDGATVVIGGIIVTNNQTNIDQVPLFGSLPVIGNLFKHTTVSSTSQELLFFLTPRIVPG